MLEWIKLSTIIIDQIFNYGPKINNIFKSKEKKNKQTQLKILCNDIANEIQKSLLSDLKAMMDYSVNTPLTQENIEEMSKVIQNVIEVESKKMVLKMKELAIIQFNDILLDNLLCMPRYHNLLIVGNNSIYRIINKLFNEKTPIFDNYEKFHLFLSNNAEFRPGLLLYGLDISDCLNLEKIPNDSKKNKNNDDNKELNDIEKKIKKVSNEILIFIKNQNKIFNNSLNRRISGIIVCIDNSKDTENIKNLIINLETSIKKYNFDLNLFLIIVNKCVDAKNLEIIEDNIKEQDMNEENIKDIKEENNINDNKDGDIIINNDNNHKNNIKTFNFTINDDNYEILDEEEENSEIEKFLSALVKQYIDDYLKNNINNIHCSLTLQFEENLTYYFQKLDKEFGKAMQELRNFNLKNLPLKVEFESQIRKIISDIFTNHIYPISNDINKKEVNKIPIKNELTNKSLNIIKDFTDYGIKIITNLTTKAKNEYTKRVLSEVKEKINDLFSELELDQGEKEKVDEHVNLKTNFVDNITQILNDKIEFSADIYNFCLTYFYIGTDMYKILKEKIFDFCKINIFENKEFIKGINKRIVQQMDSYQRRALNID